MESALQTVKTTAADTTLAITEELSGRFVKYIDAMPQTVATYKTGVRKLLAWLADKGIGRPTREDIAEYRDGLKASCKPASVSLYMSAARLFFRWTAEQGIYPNVAEHMKGAKLDRGHKRECLTSAAVRDVLSTAKGDSLAELRDYAVLAVMATCGLRCISITRANVEDLRTVAAGGELMPALYYQGKGREDKSAFVKLAPQVADAINAYLAARGKTGGEAPLFASVSHNSTGERLTTRSVSRLVKEHFQAAGYDRATLTAHSLRHTAATLALLNGEGLEQVREMLDHANINTTMVYAHAIERAKSTCEYTVAKAVFC